MSNPADTSEALDASIESAMDGHGIVRAPIVNNKVRKSGNKVGAVQAIRRTEPPNIANQVVRIINECDPVGFLADVVAGKAIQCYTVDEDGVIEEKWETPALNKRIEIAKFLTNKFMPNVSASHHTHLMKQVGQDEPGAPSDGRRNLTQIVEHAASRAECDEKTPPTIEHEPAPDDVASILESMGDNAD